MDDSGAHASADRMLVELVPAVVYIDSNDQRPDSLYISPQAEEMFGSRRPVNASLE